MASRAKSGGLLLPVVIAVVAVTIFGGDKVIDTVTDIFGNIVSSGTEIIGQGDARVMVASSAKSETKQCTAQQMVDDKRCGDLKVLVVNAKKIPFIARNTKLA